MYENNTLISKKQLFKAIDFFEKKYGKKLFCTFHFEVKTLEKTFLLKDYILERIEIIENSENKSYFEYIRIYSEDGEDFFKGDLKINFTTQEFSFGDTIQKENERVSFLTLEGVYTFIFKSFAHQIKEFNLPIKTKKYLVKKVRNRVLIFIIIIFIIMCIDFVFS